MQPKEEGLPRNLGQLKELIRAAVQEELEERGLVPEVAKPRGRGPRKP